ncbi:helix-turn-helix domain-containing protein [Nocardia mangyaensis]|uniref:helix-turn-helix domain-containing protein n=1 Tax=Nocardia mangyaensis TaxID=2213200 RepID=UPI002675BE9C|nr:helix-turn-helix transcriptional regulator [Nocardia mangyaensis]MDO3647671.1 helix-turn-helix transcriptional regulator [Nocardia mangyaensis]
MAEKKNPLGPTGETVRANIAHYRAGLNLGYAELSRQLEALGRPIPVLGLSRIEKGERRVDADDLMALAVALNVSVLALLVPPSSRPDDEVVAATASDPLTVTALIRRINRGPEIDPEVGTNPIELLARSSEFMEQLMETPAFREYLKKALVHLATTGMIDIGGPVDGDD